MASHEGWPVSTVPKPNVKYVSLLKPTDPKYWQKLKWLTGSDSTSIILPS
jgi:hypothetical protein